MIEIFLLIAGILKASEEVIQFRWKDSIFKKWKWNEQFWNPEKSANNKYKDGKKENGPKFWGSTTFLVWTTDGYHLIRFLWSICMFVAFYFYNPVVEIEFWGRIIDFFGYYVLFSFWQGVCYEYVLTNKSKQEE